MHALHIPERVADGHRKRVGLVSIGTGVGISAGRIAGGWIAGPAAAVLGSPMGGDGPATGYTGARSTEAAISTKAKRLRSIDLHPCLSAIRWGTESLHGPSLVLFSHQTSLFTY